jgi:ATP-dependent RNA helicase DDX55/SPB4
LETKRATPISEDVQKKRKIRAEMRESWSEQNDKRARKEVKKEKREKRKDEIWAQKLAEDGGVEVGMVERFKKEKAAGQVEREEQEREYKLLKREVRVERGGGRVKAAAAGGMFDGLD